MKYIVVIMVLVGVYSMLPQTVAAYATVAQSAVVLPQGDGALFSVTYDFGSPLYELRLPIVPVRQTSDDPSRVFAYTLLEDRELTTYGDTVGVVVSDAPIVDGQYVVEKGASHRFTMIVLLAAPLQEGLRTAESLSLQVTGLPFTIVSSTATVDAELNPSELQYYVTPAI